MTAIRVVLVDDEADFRIPVGRFLSKKGVEIEHCESVEALPPVLDAFAPHIIVLDVNLPGESGMDAVNRLRRTTGAGLIMVTARGDVDDRIQGLARGADAYLPKPVDLRELNAVIRSLAARLATVEEESAGWLLHTDTWALTAPDGTHATLSSTEYALVDALIDRVGSPVSRDDLFVFVGIAPHDVEDRRIDLLVSRLKAKFKGAERPLPVKAVRGIGYAFTDSVRRVGPVLGDPPHDKK